MRATIRRLHRALPILALALSLVGAPSSAQAAEGTFGILQPLASPSTGPALAGSSLPVGVLRPVMPPTSEISDEDRLVELVNAERAAAGLAPLTRQAQLASAAGDYAVVMADTDSFSHDGIDGSLPQERDEAHGYLAWTFTGENLAAGQSSPERVVRAWMASPSHRANVLSPQACDIGVGRAIARGARYDSYWVMEIGCGLFSG